MTKAPKSSRAHHAHVRSAKYLERVSRSCEEALGPISGQFLDMGFGASLFLQVAKRAYVQAAISAIRESGQRPSDSRIAALTGLQRKEIRALAVESFDLSDLSSKLPPTMRVVAAWQSDSRFLRRNGQPRVLPIDGENSFRALAAEFAGDVTPVALVRELERLGWVTRVLRSEVALSQRAADFSPQSRTIDNFAARIADYATALKGSTANAREVFYAGHRETKPTDPRIGASLTRTFGRRAEEFLNGFDRWIARSHGQLEGDAQPPAAATYGVGIYIVKRGSDRQLTPPKKKPTPRAKRA